jgi:predicted HicB family RNase H-like nuclease
MSQNLTYKGIIGSVEFSSEDDCFFGKLEGISDLVTFEGDSVSSLKAGFQEAVDDYLALCASTGKTPEKSFKGTFNVRLTPELHRKVAHKAIRCGKTLNQFVQESLAKAVSVDEG